MTLAEQLTHRIQDVADVAGKPGQEEEFTRAYQDLLAELTSAIRMMKQLAVAQAVWLRRQAGISIRMN